MLPLLPEEVAAPRPCPRGRSVGKLALSSSVKGICREKGESAGTRHSQADASQSSPADARAMPLRSQCVLVPSKRALGIEGLHGMAATNLTNVAATHADGAMDGLGARAAQGHCTPPRRTRTMPKLGQHLRDTFGLSRRPRPALLLSREARCLYFSLELRRGRKPPGDRADRGRGPLANDAQRAAPQLGPVQCDGDGDLVLLSSDRVEHAAWRQTQRSGIGRIERQSPKRAAGPVGMHFEQVRGRILV